MASTNLQGSEKCVVNAFCECWRAGNIKRPKPAAPGRQLSLVSAPSFRDIPKLKVNLNRTDLMNCKSTDIPGLLIIEPGQLNDSRGFFMESYSRRKYIELGIDDEFVQDNISLSLKSGTIRGMHYQLEPMAQSKLIRTIRGKTLNVVVDLRKGSPAYGKWTAITLLPKQFRLLYVPRGLANGFCSLEDSTEIEYKVDAYYSPEHERSFRWNDAELDIDWPVTDPILSEKDRAAPPFKEAEHNFTYREK